MARFPRTALFSLAAIGAATVALAQQSPEEAAVNARQSHMTLYAYNVGKLGAMAQGQAEYDAAVATEAAANLERLSQLSQEGYWLEGTAEGEHEDSRALPAIWENAEDFEARHATLEQAVAGLQGAAGVDLASLQAALGGVGQACGGCHENYRASDD